MTTDPKIVEQGLPPLFSRVVDNEYYPNTKVIVRPISPQIGLGMFAAEDIVAGAIVERCPLLELEHRTKYLHDPKLRSYMFVNGNCPCQECKVHGNVAYIALGYGSLYNHSDSPNTQLIFDYKKCILDIVAKEHIKKDEQVFVTYGERYFRNRPKLEMHHPPKELSEVPEVSV